VLSSLTGWAGNVLLNLDKQYHNEVFTIFYNTEVVPNFSYNPAKVLRVVLRGKVADLGVGG
jgi:hypothetical protein